MGKKFRHQITLPVIERTPVDLPQEFFYVIGNYSVMFLLHKNAPRGCDQSIKTDNNVYRAKCPERTVTIMNNVILMGRLTKITYIQPNEIVI